MALVLAKLNIMFAKVNKKPLRIAKAYLTYIKVLLSPCRLEFKKIKKVYMWTLYISQGYYELKFYRKKKEFTFYKKLNYTYNNGIGFKNPFSIFTIKNVCRIIRFK